MNPDSFMLARALASERTHIPDQWRHSTGGTGQTDSKSKVLHSLIHKLQRCAADWPPLRHFLGFLGLGWLRASVEKR